MAEEQKQDAQETSSSPLAEAIASSPEVQQEVAEQVSSETATPQEAETKVHEPPEEHPRFREVIEERNYWRDKAMNQLQQPQPQQPTTLPQELGNTPEEREFWRIQRQIAREEALKVAQEKEEKINQAIQFLTTEVTSDKIEKFREKHPDIKPNSLEETEIANKLKMGYRLEDAYRVVMWDRKVVDAEKQANINAKQKIEAKKQANVEQRSIPSGATPPTKEKLTLRQRIEKAAEEIEL